LPKAESRSMRPGIRTEAAGADSLDQPINDTGEAAQNLHENLPGTMPGGAGRRAGTRRVSDAIDPPGPARRAHADPGRLPVLTMCHVIRATTVDT